MSGGNLSYYIGEGNIRVVGKNITWTKEKLKEYPIACNKKAVRKKIK